MPDIWYTSDTHFDHKNILKFAGPTRRGETVEEMNELLIEAWNSKVKPDDIVWFLGDFSFGNVQQIKDVLNRLQGKIQLVPGNHDKLIMRTRELYDMFDGVHTSVIVNNRVGRDFMVYCHFPIYEWEGASYGWYHLHGHSHGHVIRFPEWRLFDVGIDNRPDNLMLPWNHDEIIAMLKARPARDHENVRNAREGYVKQNPKV